ncbi:MAG: ThuA domain-containing protein [Opitutaceae bacterium]
MCANVVTHAPSPKPRPFSTPHSANFPSRLFSTAAFSTKRNLPSLLCRLASLSATLAVTVSAFSQPASTPPAPNLGAAALKSPPLAKKIVLIGGKKSHGEGEHDFPNGIPLIAAMLKASPAFASADVLAYTGGFPADPAVLDGASTLVLYFDGVQEKPEPLLDPARIPHVQKLVDAGAGLVALHQASTLPKGNTTVPLVEWLGAKRDGMFDRTTETVTLKPVTPAHPISAGVGEFTYKDEFYPTLVFHSDAARITPILRARVGATAKKEHVLAWAFERANSGRSFGFTGAHYLAAFDEPAIRQLLVNAVAWTAHLDVPKGGIVVPGPVVGKSVVNRHDENRVVDMPWGQLRWYTSAEMKNTRTMTTGVAILKPGQTNPRHFHPNCDEILHVVSGKIRHTMNEVSVEMNAGDTVSIPQGVLHNASNVGAENAVLAISFSTAYREAVGYDTK